MSQDRNSLLRRELTLHDRRATRAGHERSLRSHSSLAAMPRARSLTRAREVSACHERLAADANNHSATDALHVPAADGPCVHIHRRGSFSTARDAAPQVGCRWPAPRLQFVRMPHRRRGARSGLASRLRALPACRARPRTGRSGAPCPHGLAEARWAVASAPAPRDG